MSTGRFTFLLTVLLAAGCAADTDSPATRSETDPPPAAFSPLEIGAQAPDYRVVSPSGDTLSVVSEDHVTLLNLWATWCGPCRVEFPDLERLHRDLGPRGLRVLGVDVDANPPETVIRFGEELGASFQLASDHAGRIRERFRSMGLPSSYLIGRDGQVLATWTGILPDDARNTILTHVPGGMP